MLRTFLDDFFLRNYISYISIGALYIQQAKKFVAIIEIKFKFNL
jgi:hypothetical protein